MVDSPSHRTPPVLVWGLFLSNDPIDIFALIDMRGPDECWPWLGTWGGRGRDKRPYFMSNKRRTMCYRWVWELVHGEKLTADVLLLHSCDNGGWPIGCSNPKHLRKGTVADNSADMTDRQRHGLPGTVVRAIRRLLEQGKTELYVAEQYGLTRETVSAIKTGRAYKHVNGDGNATDSGDGR
jgi:hypothetical protein